MRLWSLHPRYLDSRGLVAWWREGLLAQAVLSGQTKGYRHHPQLKRFLETPAPADYLSTYLTAVLEESRRRGFRFDGGKLGRALEVPPLTVTRGQLDYEWAHLLAKVQRRAPEWFTEVSAVTAPEPHPLFRVVEGGVAPWEVVRH